MGTRHIITGHIVTALPLLLARAISRQAPPEPPADHPYPILDHSRFTVTFRGRTCRLGNTIPFRFLARLAETPERYVSHEKLIDDVWGGHDSDDALRSVVKHLRRRLRQADRRRATRQ